MAKKKEPKPQREVTKRQLSKWQRQQKRQRIIMAAGIFVVVAVIGVIGSGWYINDYQPLHQTVIRVNDTKFSMDYYVKMLKYYGEGQPFQYMEYIADEAVTLTERNELLRQGAMKLGISVSNSEVDEKLKEGDPPLSKDYRDIARTDLLVDKLRDEYFEQEIPVSAEQRHTMAIFLESESQAAGVRARLEAGEGFAGLAGELSLESISKSNGGDLDWHSQDALAILLDTSVPAGYAFNSEVDILSPPLYDEAKTKWVGYWLVELLERDEETEQVHVQVILLGSEEKAQEIRAGLEAGEDFAALAEEFSQHEASREGGGDLGFISREAMTSALSEFAFDPELELGTLSEPIRDDTVQTEGGYWLVEVVGIDDSRELSGEDRDLLKGRALNDWMESLWDDPENEVESYLDDEKKGWAIQRAISD